MFNRDLVKILSVESMKCLLDKRKALREKKITSTVMISKLYVAEKLCLLSLGGKPGISVGNSAQLLARRSWVLSLLWPLATYYNATG